MSEFFPKILIVDDSSENLKLLGNGLKNRNFNVLTALNGKQALALIESKKPDLILLDVMMPVMDGFEVCQRLKSSPQLSTIPIIFLTALNDLQTIKRSLELGAVDYATKPFNLEELVLKINNQLRIKKQFDYNARWIELLKNVLRCVTTEDSPESKDALTRVSQLLAADESYFAYNNNSFTYLQLIQLLRETLSDNIEYDQQTENRFGYSGFELMQLLFRCIKGINSSFGISPSDIKAEIRPVSERVHLFTVHVSIKGYEQQAEKLGVEIANEDPDTNNMDILTFQGIRKLLNFKIKKPEDSNDYIVEIPICREVKEDASGNVSVSSAVNAKKGSVLIVEDNELNQEYMQLLLQGFNLNYDLAKNGHEAIDKATKNEYDVILMDVNLPGMSGLEITSILRTKYNYKKFIVAVSGHTEQSFIQECLQSGFNEFLTKPYTVKDIEKVLKKYSHIENVEKNGETRIENEGFHSEYDYSRAVELANGSRELLDQWFDSFCELLEGALSLTNEIKQTQEYKRGSKEFHALINYSSYFRITKVANCITDIQRLSEQLPDRKVEFLNAINALEVELNCAKSHYMKELRPSA
ncbi:MAG: response regulator receiver modulated diguanylate cyclase [Bacteroidetes bacterium]|jgi:CheY-like chemotaxis protein|nr:response regulator receiver modulated diguanylate cyclase [Bacteroidota bacterium]